MIIQPVAEKGAYWGGALFSLGGHDNPTDVQLKNAIFEQVVLQQGSLAGRRPTQCTRQAGPAPVYLPCGQASWVGSRPGLINQWDAPPPGSTVIFPIEPTLDDFTYEWSTYGVSCDGTSHFDLSWENGAGTSYFEVLVFHTPTTGGFFEVYDGTNDDRPDVAPVNLNGLHRWALQRSSGTTKLFLDGAPIVTGTTNTSSLSMTNGDFASFYIFSSTSTAGELLYGRILVTTAARYPTTGYDASAHPTPTSDSILYFQFTEGSGEETYDAISGATLYMHFDPPPALWVPPSPTIPGP